MNQKIEINKWLTYKYKFNNQLLTKDKLMKIINKYIKQVLMELEGNTTVFAQLRIKYEDSNLGYRSISDVELISTTKNKSNIYYEELKRTFLESWVIKR